MKLTKSHLKKLILETLQEAARDPQIERMRTRMVMALRDVPMNHREPMATFLSAITFDSDKDTIRKTLEALAKHAPNFQSMLD
jgi:hypothetical protein